MPLNKSKDHNLKQGWPNSHPALRYCYCLAFCFPVSIHDDIDVREVLHCPTCTYEEYWAQPGTKHWVSRGIIPG